MFGPLNLGAFLRFGQQILCAVDSEMLNMEAATADSLYKQKKAEEIIVSIVHWHSFFIIITTESGSSAITCCQNELKLNKFQTFIIKKLPSAL